LRIAHQDGLQEFASETTMNTFYATMPSPAGELLLTASTDGLTGVFFPGEGLTPAADWELDTPRFAGAIKQLEEYFAGERTEFSVPLAAPGTPFQQRVWTELRKVGYGTTISYTELARRVGCPGSVRAVGGANGRNPICIIVPCHRVIGADGSLTGYSAGVETKRWLLDFERGMGPLSPAA
jgi:methylated-DNA-[protein]-cysteine S-methyltransferase